MIFCILDSFFMFRKNDQKIPQDALKMESVLFICRAGYLINIYFYDNRFHAKFL